MKSPDRDAADEKWAVLAREYECLIKELCESADPIALLADWTVQAGLPAPKAASELATLRRRVEEMRRNRLEEAEALRRRVAELEDIGRESLGPWRQFAAYLVFICALVDMGEIEPFDEHTVISHAQGGGGTAMLTMGPLKALGHAFAKLQALLAPLPPGRNEG